MKKDLACVQGLATGDERSQCSRVFRICLRLMASPDNPGEQSAWILRVVSRLIGNLDGERSAAAVRPGTTRKVEVRVAWRANALGLKSV